MSHKLLVQRSDWFRDSPRSKAKMILKFAEVIYYAGPPKVHNVRDVRIFEVINYTQKINYNNLVIY